MFCTKCGAQVTSGSGKFCTNCGAPVSADSAQPGTPAPASPQSSLPPAAPLAATTAQPLSPTAKIVFALIGVFVFLSIAVMGTCGYFAYRVKQKVEQAKTEYGLDKTYPAVKERDVCSLLSKDEVSEITGVAITDATGSTSECSYASAKNPNVFHDSVAWQGGAMAYKLSAVTTKFNAPGGQGVVKLSGIGDEAWTIGISGQEKDNLERDEKNDQSGAARGIMGIMGYAPLFFRKGDVMVTISITEAQDADAAKKALAMKIASRI
jgi:hypothetical protein